MTACTGKLAALRAETAAERFLRLLRADAPDRCWPWSKHVGTNGYGIIGHHRRRLYAHRVAYEALVGPIPDGLFVLHRCDNPPCVNPAHLFLGTHDDNMKDAASKDRMSRAPKVKGIAHPLAKLDEEKVRAIRASAETITVLARRYGVWPTLVWRVRKRLSWKHVA